MNWKHFQIDIWIVIYCFSFRASAVAKTHVKKQIKEIYMYNKQHVTDVYASNLADGAIF